MTLQRRWLCGSTMENSSMKMTAGVTCATFALFAWTGGCLAEESLTVASWGSSYEQSQQEAYFKPFTNVSGIGINTDTYNGEIAKIRAMVEANNVTWDVVDVDTQTALQGCEDGLFLKLEWSKMGDKRRFVDGSTTDCAIGSAMWSTVLAYDTDRLKAGPTTIGDLFDLKRFPGKRALRKSPFGNLEFALLADGVPRTEVYQLLKTRAGVERAFRKLDTIKNSVVWWEAGAQPVQLLASGEVVMATAWNGRITEAVNRDHQHFRIVWDGQIPDFDMWVIVKGSKRVEAAYKFIAFASAAEHMANQSKYISYGPTNLDAIPKIPAGLLVDLPSAPQNTRTALSQDYYFWGDHGEELRGRFNTWLAH
jgi:putative spermidine/putrescine transport system substrate-binding protein